MNRFKPGQPIVCKVDKSGWYDIATDKPANGPDENDLVHADGYYCDGYVKLKEYPDDFDGFNELCFEPLVSDSVLIAELEQVKEPYTI